MHPHLIMVGIYQDMQASKDATPCPIASPSCSNNSSGGTGLNSPNGLILSKSGLVQCSLSFMLSSRITIIIRYSRKSIRHWATATFPFDHSCHFQSLLVQMVFKISHTGEPLIIRPFLLSSLRHRSKQIELAQGSGPPPAMHDHHQRGLSQGAPAWWLRGFQSSKYRSFDGFVVRHPTTAPHTSPA